MTATHHIDIGILIPVKAIDLSKFYAIMLIQMMRILVQQRNLVTGQRSLAVIRKN